MYQFVADRLRGVVEASFTVKALPAPDEPAAAVDDPDVELAIVPVQLINPKLNVYYMFRVLVSGDSRVRSRFFLATDSVRRRPLARRVALQAVC